MRKALDETERWEDPIVAEVRQAREQLFAEAGYDLEEFCRRLRERQEHEGPASTQRPRTVKGGMAKGRTAASTRRAKKARA
jgi:hypothetical protein